jgi:hypothetical protein
MPKPRRTLLANTICLYIALTVIVDAAQISPIATPFASPTIETWDSFPLGQLTGYPAASIDILDGTAIATGVHLVTYVEDIFPYQFGLGTYHAKVYDGAQGFGVGVEPASLTISFDNPVTAFGAFWGAVSTTKPIVVTFFDLSDNVLGQAQFLYGAPNLDGTLEWHG